MGSIIAYRCTACETGFDVSEGGGFFFDRLHCDVCGATRSVNHRDLGDIHLRFVKGLEFGRPYAIVRAGFDQMIQEEHPGEPLTLDAYHAAVEATLDPCTCGGRFRYDASSRCPNCRSTQESWQSLGVVAYLD